MLMELKQLKLVEFWCRSIENEGLEKDGVIKESYKEFWTKSTRNTHEGVLGVVNSWVTWELLEKPTA